MKPHSVSKKKSNKILETVHDSVSGLHRAGLIDSKKKSEFDALCSPSEKIKKTMNDIARDAISEMAGILHNMGKIDEATLKEYAIDFPEVKDLKAQEIKKIRERIPRERRIT